MPDAVGDMLEAAVRRHWPRTPSDKAKRYVDAFFDTTRIGTSAIKSSELRHHYFHELGATKLACTGVLTHIDQATKK